MEQPGAWYHITGRGIDRREIFRQELDRVHWLELLPEFVETYRVVLHAYALMDNHYHLLLETREANLSRAMQWLQTSYSMWFNRKYGRVGPLFQGRFKAIMVDRAEWGLELSRYLHLNPVRIKSLGLDKAARAAERIGARGRPDEAKVRERLERLRSYQWSSYRPYVGRASAPRGFRVTSLHLTNSIGVLFGRSTFRVTSLHFDKFWSVRKSWAHG